MNYGDHNFIEITQQTKLRVALVVFSASEMTYIVSSGALNSTHSHSLVVSSQSSSSCRASRAVLFDNVDTAKMHGLNMSNVSSRVVSSRAKWNLGYTLLLLAN